MRLAVLSAFLGLSIACFTEPSADRVWRCSVDQPLCPEGQTCINDWCTKDGTALPDLSAVDATSELICLQVRATDGIPNWHTGCLGLSRQILCLINEGIGALSERLQALC